MQTPKNCLLALALLLAIAPSIEARDLESAVAAVPNPRTGYGGWVADPAGAIDARRNDIDALIGALERQGGTEIAVVVLPSIGEFVPKQFATALFNHWGVGKKGQDNGILVLQVLDQRRIEIETGYGMEGALPDVKCHWIIEDVGIPFFKVGSFSDGHYEVVRALIRGIQNPDIGRQALVGDITAVPGARIDPAPAAYELPHTRAALTDFNPDTLTALPAAMALPVGALLLLLWSLQYRRYRRTEPEPYAEFQYYKSKFALPYLATALVAAAPGLWEYQSLQSGWSFLALIPGLFLTSRRRARRLQYLRDKPRVDPQSGAVMKRLDENADDAYLEAGNVSEEKLGSLDYDVWVAPSGSHKIERYEGDTSASNCSHCGYKTDRQTGSRTIRAATTSSSGLAEDTYQCAHCGRSRVVQRTLPKISSSSGSGGSSGGGSFGGGSSGGGGAGGSY